MSSNWRYTSPRLRNNNSVDKAQARLILLKVYAVEMGVPEEWAEMVDDLFRLTEQPPERTLLPPHRKGKK